MDDGQNASVFSALGNFVSQRECLQIDTPEFTQEDGGPIIQPEMGFDLMTDSDLWILFTG